MFFCSGGILFLLLLLGFVCGFISFVCSLLFCYSFFLFFFLGLYDPYFLLFFWVGNDACQRYFSTSLQSYAPMTTDGTFLSLLSPRATIIDLFKDLPFWALRICLGWKAIFWLICLFGHDSIKLCDRFTVCLYSLGSSNLSSLSLGSDEVYVWCQGNSFPRTSTSLYGLDYVYILQCHHSFTSMLFCMIL